MEFLHLSIIVIVVLNVVVSLYLLKRDTLDSFQKGAQIVLVWLIPVMGALGLWFFNRNDEKSKLTSELGGGPRDSSGSDAGLD